MASVQAEPLTDLPYGWPTCDDYLIPRLRYCPVEPTAKQQLLTCLNVFEAFYGGAAGGAKSWALLMAALQFVDVPGYAALIIRRTYQDLSLPGALIDIAHEWLDGTDAKWDSNLHEWTFPSGAKLVFGYLDAPNDHLRYKSTAFQFVGIDEMSEIREIQALYLMSRMRRPVADERLKSAPDGLTLADVPLRFRGASNPGGLYPRYLFDRYVNPASHKQGTVFIPAKLRDNPFLDAESYQQSLRAMDNALLLAQLLDGVWDLDPEGAMFKKDRLVLVDRPFDDKEVVARIRFWDMASSEKTKMNADPDWTVGSLIARNKTGLFRVEDVVRFREEPAKTEENIRETAERDGYEIPIAIEAIGVGKIFYSDFQRRVLAGFQVERDSFKGMTGPKDKITRARMAASSWNQDNWSWVVKQNTRECLDEVGFFGVPGYGGHDDIVDSLSGGHRLLTRKKKTDYAAPSGTMLT